MLMYSSRTVVSLRECGGSREILWELFFLISALCINGEIRWGLKWGLRFPLSPLWARSTLQDWFFGTYLFVRFSKTVEIFGIILSSLYLEETSSTGVILITFIKPANTLLIHAKIVISYTTYNSYGPFVALI